MNYKNQAKKTIMKLVFFLLRKIKDQKTWELILKETHKRMNFGRGGDFEQSGELYVLQLIRKLYKDKSSVTIFDVGAHEGLYTLNTSELFNGKARIYAFEPSVSTFRKMLNNISGLSNVTINNLGFSDKSGEFSFFMSDKNSLLSSVYKRKLDHFGLDMVDTEKVTLSTIDEYCNSNGIENINFLKLDVEGHELAVLKGSEKMINDGKIDIIQFEFGGCNIDSKTFFQDFYYLLKDSYSIFRILENNLYEIEEYKELYEIFSTVNYLAVRKGINL
jgi:FkbM family methyltransferase